MKYKVIATVRANITSRLDEAPMSLFVFRDIATRISGRYAPTIFEPTFYENVEAVLITTTADYKSYTFRVDVTVNESMDSTLTIVRAIPISDRLGVTDLFVYTAVEVTAI